MNSNYDLFASSGVHFVVLEAGRGQAEFIRYTERSGRSLYIDLDGVILNYLDQAKQDWNVVLSGDGIPAVLGEAASLDGGFATAVVNTANTIRSISQLKWSGKLWQRGLFRSLVLVSSVLLALAPKVYFVHAEPFLPNLSVVPKGVPGKIYTCAGDVWVFGSVEGKHLIQRL